jgi:hypothetical protein
MAGQDLNGQSVVMPKRLAPGRTSKSLADTQSPGSIIPNTAVLNRETVRSLRATSRIADAIRKLVKIDGTVSTSVLAYTEVAYSGWTVMAYGSLDHEFSAEGTEIANSIISSMDTLYDYSEGYADKPSFTSIVKGALRETFMIGAVSGELVLNKLRLPEKIVLVEAESLQWKVGSNGRKFPMQQSSAGQVDLNIPTFFYNEIVFDPKTPYCTSLLESAINSSFYFIEFVEDMRRVIRKDGHARLWVQLDSEKVKNTAPPEIQGDPDKMTKYMEEVRAQVERVVADLEPEEALVGYDFAKVEQLQSKGEKRDYKEMIETLSGLLATSLKSHPSILGLRLAGSQSLSNTESLIFLKMVEAIRQPVESMLSRMLTLAARLYGHDVYVKFKFDPVNLRPHDELEAFKTMKQQRILEALSYGFLDDDQAAIMLGWGKRPPGAPPLSGTMFYKSTVRAEDASPNADPMGRALQPDSPTKAGGKSQ